MKKVTTTIISFAMILIFASTSYSLVHINTGIIPKASAITILYSVTVNLNEDNTICGNYMVMITDSDGNPVIPGKPYMEGVSTYYFSEASYGFIGVREAHLVALQNLDNVCNQQMVAEPAAMFNMYIPGQMYMFNLYPVFGAQHE